MSELAARFNKGKPKLSLVMEARKGLEGIANVLETAITSGKYTRSNWRKGLKHTEIIDSLCRHVSEYMEGNEFDSDTGLPIVDLIACNALFLADGYRNHPSLDDREIKLNDSDHE